MKPGFLKAKTSPPNDTNAFNTTASSQLPARRPSALPFSVVNGRLDEQLPSSAPESEASDNDDEHFSSPSPVTFSTCASPLSSTSGSDDRANVLPALAKDTNKPVFLYVTGPSGGSDTAIVIRRGNADIIATRPFWTVPASSLCLSDAPTHVVVRSVLGQSGGLVATRALKGGETVVRERPILVVAWDCLDSNSWTVAEKAIAGLSPPSLSIFTNLSNSFSFESTTPPNFGRFRTHALDVVLFTEQAPSLVVFATIGRANHDCTPSSHFWFDLSTFTARLQPIRPISTGEQLTVAYCQLDASRKNRRKFLLERFNLNCTCQTCSLPPDQVAESDSRRERIAQALSLSPEQLTRDVIDNAIRDARRERLPSLEALLLRKKLTMSYFRTLTELVNEGEVVRKAFILAEGSESQSAKEILNWFTNSTSPSL